MPAHQAGPEWQEVPLGARGLEHVQGVDAEPVEDDGQLVHERDVQVALGVLDDLGGLGLLDGRRGVHARSDDGTVERGDPVQGFRTVARHHLGDAGQGVLPVAGVDALGRVAHEKVLPPGQPALPLQDGHAHFLGHAWVHRGLEDHHGPRLQVAPHDPGRALHRREVRPPVLADGSRHGHDDEIRLLQARGVRGRLEMHGRRKPGGVHFAHGVDVAPVVRHLPLGQIEPDGPEAFPELDRQRQPDIPKPDNGNDGFIHDLPTYCA